MKCASSSRTKHQVPDALHSHTNRSPESPWPNMGRNRTTIYKPQLLWKLSLQSRFYAVLFNHVAPRFTLSFWIYSQISGTSVQWSYRGRLFRVLLGGGVCGGDPLLGQELGDEAHGRAQAVRQVLGEFRHQQRDPLCDLQYPMRRREHSARVMTDSKTLRWKIQGNNVMSLLHFMPLLYTVPLDHCLSWPPYVAVLHCVLCIFMYWSHCGHLVICVLMVFPTPTVILWLTVCLLIRGRILISHSGIIKFDFDFDFVKKHKYVSLLFRFVALIQSDSQ